MNDLYNGMIQALGAIEQRRPVIHQITNYVTMGVCANALCALGASPVMACAPEEAAAVTAQSQALVLNLGTPDRTRFQTALACGHTAAAQGIPCILDPVGVGATAFRKEETARLLANISPQVIKGNVAESKTLLGFSLTENHLIDSADFLTAPMQHAFSAYANEKNAVFAVTGQTNFLTDGQRCLCIAGGSPYLTRFSGAGCLTGSLIGAFLAVCPPWQAAIYAVASVTVAARAAEPAAHGTGTFLTHFFDALSHLTDLLQKGMIPAEEIFYEP